MFRNIGIVPRGRWLGGYWMIDVGEALNFAWENEEVDAPRPAALLLQEREETRDVQLSILEFAGFARLQANSRLPAKIA